MSQRFWQTARRETLYLALAGMDLCVLLPIVLAISQFTIHLPKERAGLPFFAVILLAFNLVRALNALNLKESIQRDIGLGILLLWIFLALRLTLYRHYPLFNLGWIKEMTSHLKAGKAWFQDMTIIFAVLAFWWRGLALAARPLTVDSVGHHFRAGTLLMAGTVALASRLLDWSSIPFVLAYFFLSLLAVALTRAEEVGRWRAGLVFPFSAGWLFSIMAAAGATILLATGLIALFSGENILQILALLGPVWDLLGYLVAGAITLFIILLSPLIKLLVNWLKSAMEGRGGEILEPLTDPAFALRPGDPVTEGPMANWALYQPILTGLLVAGVILVIALAFGRLWQARSQLGTVQTEPVQIERNNLAGRARKGIQSLLERIGFMNRWYTAASIRRIYAQMVATAGRCGYPRADSETPLEYLPTLVEAWPDLGAQLGMITNAYIRAHYGELPETERELETIRMAWKRIQSLVRLNRSVL